MKTDTFYTKPDSIRLEIAGKPLCASIGSVESFSDYEDISDDFNWN